MLELLGTVGSFVLVLGVLIFVHELGHFAVAKWVGIRVERFSLGFPPKLISFTKGETEYCISIVPLGGYVKMAGENPDEAENTGAPYEFMSKTPLQRAAVIIAGPLMNVVTALVIYTGLIAVQGNPTIDQERFTIGNFSEESPAKAAGLLEGDVITRVDDTPIVTLVDLRTSIAGRAGETAIVEYERNGAGGNVSLVLGLDSIDVGGGQIEEHAIVGVFQKINWEPAGFFGSIKLGVSETVFMTGKVIEFLYMFISGQASMKSVGGPLYIAQVSGEAARLGIESLLRLIAVLSVNLAIVNVLPIPVLDGGHLVFLGVEVLRRKPLTLKQRAVMQQIGLAFLLTLIILVTYNDISRWLTG